MSRPPNNGFELTKPAQAMELRSSTQCCADNGGRTTTAATDPELPGFVGAAGVLGCLARRLHFARVHRAAGSETQRRWP
jgi:hypothetical protein